MRSPGLEFVVLVSSVICVWLSINFENVGAASSKRKSNVRVCANEECKRSATMLAATMDTSKDPCTDLHTYSCGKFEENNRILPQDLVSSHYFYRKRTVLDKVEEYLQKKDDHPRSSVRKARNYFASCMDEDTIDKYGVESLRSELEMVGLQLSSPFAAAPPMQPFDYSSVIARMHRYALKINMSNFMFNANLRSNPEDIKHAELLIENTPITVLNVGFFGELDDGPVSNNVVQDDPTFDNAPTIMKEYIVKAVLYIEAAATGLRPSPYTVRLIEERAQGVIDLLFALHTAATTPSKESPERGTLQLLRDVTNRDLANSWIKFDWFTYIDALFENIEGVDDVIRHNIPVRIAEPTNMQNVFNVLANTRPDIFPCAVWWMVVHSVIPMTTKPLRYMRYEYEQRTFGRAPMPRNLACTKDTIELFGEAITYHMIREENGVEKKKEIFEMTKYIETVIEKRIKKASWLDRKTRKNILARMGKLTGTILFTDGLEDPKHVNELYAKVKVDKSQFYKTTMKKLRDDKTRYLETLLINNGKKNLAEEMNPVEMVARYHVQENELEISLAFAGFPYFDLGLPSLNFGALGVIMAHELMHSLGPAAQWFDEDGNVNINWSQDALAKYGDKAKCFIRSYSSFFVYDSEGKQKYVNGLRTLEENLADNAGFSVALEAYRDYVNEHEPEPKLINFEKFSNEKLFTLAFATTWCETTTSEFRAMQIEIDPHAPSKFRVNGVAQNSEDFSNIWGCPKNALLNPPDKCNIF